MQKKLRLRFKLLIGGTVLIVLAAAAVIVANVIKTPKPRQIDGQVEVLQYSVQVQQRGKVLEIRVKEGDYVEVGDTLALYRTDDTPMPEDATLELLATTLHPYRTGNKNVDRAYGRWQQAKSAEEQAERIYNDVQQKFMNGKAPASLRDNVFTEYKTLQVQALSLKADYEKALHNLKTEKSNSKGPQIIAIVTKVEGEVSEIVVKRGEQLSANNTLMSIALLDNLWGSIAVTRNEKMQFKEGDTIQVYCKPFNMSVPMRVSGFKANFDFLDPNNYKRGNEGAQTWEMQLRPVYKVEGLRPGMQLSIAVRADEET